MGDAPRITKYGLLSVTHSDGQETSTLALPSFVWLGSTMSLGNWIFLHELLEQAPKDLQESFFSTPVDTSDLLTVLGDTLRALGVTLLATGAVVLVNHALTLYVPPYRRLNATLTAATSYAPSTVRAAGSLGAAVGAFTVLLQRPATPAVSRYLAFFISQSLPATVGSAYLYARFLGQFGSATWYGVDRLRNAPAADKANDA